MTSAERFEIAWRGAQKTISFRELAKRIGPHTILRNKIPLSIEYSFPDGSSIVSYSTGTHHRYKVFTSRRARNA